MADKETAGDGVKVHDLVARYETLRNDRGQFDQHWQDIADVMLPRRADFTTTQTVGERRTDQIFDGTAMQARRALSAAVSGLLKPKTSKWFRMTPVNDALKESDAVKEWMETAEDRMYQAIYARPARFVQRSGEVDNDLVSFGTGVLFCGENLRARSLMFRSYSLNQAFIGENGDGEVDTVFVAESLTARQAAQRFGEKSLGQATRDALNSNNPQDKNGKRYVFVQAVMPRTDFDPRRRDSINLPVASYVVDISSKHIVREGGYHEFPFAVPRWDTTSGEVYGRSPAMIALPDALTGQQMGKTLLQAGHRAVDPPLLAADDSVIGPLKTFPGGVTAFDAEVARDFGGIPVRPLDTGFQYPIGRDMQEDNRQQIWQAFFRNVLNLPTEGPQMTAFEVAQRKEEFVRTIGPVFGQLETDYLAVVVERSFNIMLRAGAFPPPPPELEGESLEFEYTSPVEQARKQIEALGASQSIQLLDPFVQADPQIMDNFDGDEIARSTPEIFGMPQKFLRSKEEVAAVRQQRQEQQVLEALPGAAEQGTQAVKNLADAEAALSSE